jgi:hypothetical protein
MIRLLYVLIVVFWMTMMGLLIRTEMSPRGATLREVPVEHVLKLLFHHQQTSHLHIFSDSTRLGHFTLTPKVEETGRHKLEFNGHVSTRPTTAERQRFSWEGALLMGTGLEGERLTFGLSFHDEGLHRAQLEVDAETKLAYFQLRSGDRVLQESSYSLDEKGATQVLQQLGMDVVSLQALTGKSHVRPELRAQQSSMTVHGERIQTYLVSLQQSGQTLLELHVSQLGQVLRVKTFIGYNLAPDDLAP